MFGAGGLAFVVLALIAARISKQSLAALSTQDKAHLVDVAARTPIYWFLITVALFGSWLAIVIARPSLAPTVTPVALSLIIVLSSTVFLVTYRQYRRIGLPPAFMRAFVLSRALRLVGAAVFFVTTCLWLNRAFVNDRAHR